MNDFSPSTLNLLSQLPGSVGFKNTEFVYEFLNNQGLDLFGIQSLPKTNLTDDLLCSSNTFDIIRKQDEDILYQGEIKNTILFYRKKDMLFWGEKKPYFQNDKITGILTHGTLLDKKFFNALKSLNFMTESKQDIQVLTVSKQIVHDSKITLNHRQQQCLFWFLRGKTSREIGTLIHISHRTVDGHLDDIKEVYGLKKRRELFDLAQVEGWLYVMPFEQLKRMMASS